MLWPPFGRFPAAVLGLASSPWRGRLFYRFGRNSQIGDRSRAWAVGILQASAIDSVAATL